MVQLLPKVLPRQGTQPGGRVERVADLELRSQPHESLLVLVGDGLGHQKALGGDARLARVLKASLHADLGSLLKSVNPRDVQTAESFLASAFVGTGPGLRNIIVTGQQLFDALVAAQPETVNLVVDGRINLNTLQATDGDLATFSQGLASLTGQLRNSNSDLQALINNSVAAEQQLNPFLTDNSAQIAAAIANLATDSQLSNQFQPEVHAIFQLLPFVSDDLAAVVSGGQVHGVLDINTSETVCPYILGSQMPGPTQKLTSPSLTNTCSSTAPDMLQRGATSTPAFASAAG